MNIEEQTKYLIDVNHTNYAEVHSAMVLICQLIAESKLVTIDRCDMVEYGRTTPGFVVTVSDRETGDSWVSEPSYNLADAIEEIWMRIPEAPNERPPMTTGGRYTERFSPFSVSY